MVLSEFAPAKLNLGLWILGRRDDGYHELLSLMVPIDWGDELMAETSPDLCIRYQPPQLFERDLVRQAAERMQETLRISRGAKILVHKRIPIGSGLGGGSSDAAATVRLLQRLWGHRVDDEQLQRLAQGLGSDVPFFLRPQPAVVRGRGERIQPVSMCLPYSFLVLYPGFPIATAWAYAQVDLAGVVRCSEPAVEWEAIVPSLALQPELFQRYLVNEFEPVLFAHYPVLRQLRDELLQAGAFYAAVTGSGSAVFGVFATEDEARRASRRWDHSPIQTCVCRVFTGTV
ncbi:MAG: 4-(cytidine 5'-diphospho)-2-C-methyl-D-erythritol kinase [Candidatus Kapabacteria bacterium]|nr:4-(cytidine 5'-diphospho)-2-C-methyl-D-erythritol kinase [Candidatus Kapabacteria bacterium]